MNTTEHDSSLDPAGHLYRQETRSQLGDETRTEQLLITLGKNQTFTHLSRVSCYDSFDGETTTTESQASGQWHLVGDTVRLEGTLARNQVNYKHCQDEEDTPIHTTRPFQAEYTLTQLRQMEMETV